MSVQDIPPEFEELLNRLLDSPEGEFSSTEFETFQNILEQHPEAMLQYFEYIDINTGIKSDWSERLQSLEQIVTRETPAPSSAPAITQVHTPGPRRSRFINYALVAVASMMILLLMEWMIAGRFFWNQPQLVKTEQPVADLPYIATLTRATDCVWGGNAPPKFSGQRLLSQDLFLEEGFAEFRFDTGVRLIIEGPTRIKMDSTCCATVSSGKVVLHGYEAAPEFALVTPQLTFHDIGTEYGAKIDADGEVDLHVFEGSVRVDPNQDNQLFTESIIITEGQAKHLKENRADDIQINPEDFKREVPTNPKNLQAIREETRAYDSFHPPVISDPESFSDWRNAGIGWKNPWRNKLNGGDPARGDSQPLKSLTGTKLAENQLGLVELRKGNTAWRTLEKPVRLNKDAIYYLSFYIQKQKSGKGTNKQYGNLSLQTSTPGNHQTKILLGMSSHNFSTLQAGMQVIENAPPLQSEQTYFFVAKIVASENALDQIFMRAFAPEESIPSHEPPVWTCTTEPFRDSSVYDQVRLHAARNADFLFDELRIGTTWDSVINTQSPAAAP
ncbi:MAG: hypothetical protein CME33_17360 [Gimesia sp.]|uniref:hypothetical protein n=1 Tax=Gimesia sp. TaxID=2024833 RepID=UPI000C567354|nr:hypothetical protein [Gimesia sp.]MAX38324.1 hypothetical protein [Gimesia sp.]|tara:strand:+ start:5420 stop:7090 length:1671 start_codon:yes stop_codon:yes gene_type:complete